MQLSTLLILEAPLVGNTVSPTFTSSARSLLFSVSNMTIVVLCLEFHQFNFQIMTCILFFIVSSYFSSIDVYDLILWLHSWLSALFFLNSVIWIDKSCCKSSRSFDSTSRISTLHFSYVITVVWALLESRTCISLSSRWIF